MWPIWFGITANSSAIHNSTIRDASSSRCVCRLWVSLDKKNKHKSIMLSCLALSRISTIQTQIQVFNTPHEEESDLLPFMDYLIQLQESVKRHLFNKMSLEVTPKVEKDYGSTFVYPFCHKKLESDKMRHHAYVVGEYSNGVEVKHYEAGQYIFTCCKKCNLQLSFNKENYRLPVYLHNGSHYDFHHEIHRIDGWR